MSAPDDLLVGGEPTAVLAASSALQEVAFRTDDVALDLVRALGPAATTVAAAVPFAPARALAVRVALENVAAGPTSGLGQVASLYEVASTELRLAGQALEAAGVASAVGRGHTLLLAGGRPQILPELEGVDVRRETLAVGGSSGPAGASGALGMRLVERPDGSTFYVVEGSLGVREATAAGVQLNGVGGFVEAAKGAEVTLRWAVPTRDDALMLVAALGTGGLPLLARGEVPVPNETTVANVHSATGVATAPVPVAGASGTAGLRREVTVLADGSSRLALTVSGSGQAALLGLAGVGGAGSMRIALERNAAGAITRLSLATSQEVDRGRHGLPMIENLNREATLVEREWEVELDPQARHHAERIAAALAIGQAPDEADVRTLTHLITGLGYEETTYDVRHQQLSVDVALPKLDFGGSVGVDIATRRNP